jgi:hypothetical protein
MVINQDLPCPHCGTKGQARRHCQINCDWITCTKCGAMIKNSTREHFYDGANGKNPNQLHSLQQFQCWPLATTGRPS